MAYISNSAIKQRKKLLTNYKFFLNNNLFLKFNLSEDTVTIALSESGTTQQTVSIASQLQQRGCTLISITNSGHSVLAKMADCNISYHVTEKIVNERNVTTQIPVLYIIEALAKKLYNGKN